MAEVLEEGKKYYGRLGGMFGQATGYEQFSPELYKVDETAFGTTPGENILTDAILARAQGQGGPSVAEQQLQQGLEQIGTQASGMAAAQRGISPALAARQAQQAQAQAAAQTNQQAGILRAQEQLAAQQLGANVFQDQAKRRMAREQLKVQGSLGGEQLRGQAYEGSANRTMGTVKGIGQAIATGGMAHGGIVGYADGGMVQPSEPMDSFAAAVAQQVGQMMAKGFEKPKEETDLSGVISMMKSSNGMYVPGEPKVDGDSEVNDTVPTMLSPGEIVVPRTIAKKSPQDIAKFVMALRGGM